MIVELDTISSTMDYARELLRSHTLQIDKSGMLSHQAVICKYQTSGRGQRGREWVSMDGDNLYSTLFYQGIPLTGQSAGHVSLIAGAAVAEAVYLAFMESHWPNNISNIASIGIKWPNDILLNCKKAGGILIEIENDSQVGPVALIGTGINIGTSKLSPELTSSATSFLLENMKPVPPMRLLQWILHALDRLTYIYKIAGLSGILRRWRHWDATTGMKFKCNTSEGWIGTAVGLDDNGHLILRKEDGSQFSVLGATHLI